MLLNFTTDEDFGKAILDYKKRKKLDSNKEAVQGLFREQEELINTLRPVEKAAETNTTSTVESGTTETTRNLHAPTQQPQNLSKTEQRIMRITSLMEDRKRRLAAVDLEIAQDKAKDRFYNAGLTYSGTKLYVPDAMGIPSNFFPSGLTPRKGSRPCATVNNCYHCRKIGKYECMEKARVNEQRPRSVNV